MQTPTGCGEKRFECQFLDAVSCGHLGSEPMAKEFSVYQTDQQMKASGNKRIFQETPRGWANKTWGAFWEDLIKTGVGEWITKVFMLPISVERTNAAYTNSNENCSYCFCVGMAHLAQTKQMEKNLQSNSELEVEGSSKPCVPPSTVCDQNAECPSQGEAS